MLAAISGVVAYSARPGLSEEGIQGEPGPRPPRWGAHEPDGAGTDWVALAQPEAAEPPAEPPLDPTQVRVHLRNGGQITGVLFDQSDKGVVLKIGGITMAVNFAEIDRVETLPSLLQRYQEMKAAIPERDAEQLVMLVQWLISVEKHEWALREVQEVLTAAPEHPEGVRLKRVIESQMELLREPRPTPRRPGAEAARPARGEFPLLTPEEINLIKVYEIDLERPPRLVVSRQTVEELMAAYAGDPLIPATKEGREALLRTRPERVLDLMFRLRARDFYGRVQVLDMPAPFRKFRESSHQTWLLNSCATSRCHGGEQAGRLYLATRRPNSEQTVFTNFLILDRFKTSKGVPLIDYSNPARSPLLQIGLPREDSVFPHPPVPTPAGRGDEFRPVFRSTEDRRFREAVEWIKGMYMPRPEYPIGYTPPIPGGVENAAPVTNGEPAGR